MDEIEDQLLFAMQTMINSEITPDQASAAEEFIRTFQTENQKYFVSILIDILALTDIEEMLVVQCFIYLKIIFTPTRLISQSTIREQYFNEYQDIHVALYKSFKNFVFSDSLAIRTNVAASFARFIATIGTNTLEIFNELLEIVEETKNEAFDDGLMRLTYESDILSVYPPRGFEGYFIGVHKIAKKYINMAASNEEFDYEMLLSGLHIYKLLIPFLIDTFKENDFEEVNYFITICQSILPKSEINSYTLIFDILHDISIYHYSDAPLFFEDIYNIVMQGFNTEDDFLEATFLFWKKLAQDEYKIFYERYPMEYNNFLRSDKGPIGAFIVDTKNQTKPAEPSDLIKNSLGTVDNIDNQLLDALLTMIRPPDDCPTSYDYENPYLRIPFAAASTLQECILLNPELIEYHIIPRVSELISSESWQDVMAAILILQALCTYYQWRPLIRPIKDFLDVMIEILGIDIPILVGSTPIVATTILHKYSSIKSIDIISRILDKFSNPLISSDNSLFTEYMALLRVSVISVVTPVDSAPLIEFFNENFIPLLSDPLKITPISLFIIETANEVFPSEYSGILFNAIEQQKTPEGNLYDISYCTLGTLVNRFSDHDADVALGQCGQLLLDIIHDAESEIDVSDILGLIRGLLMVLREPKFEDVIKEYSSQILEIIQKCFQTENPVVLSQASRVLGPFVQRTKERRPEIDEAIDAVLQYLEDSPDEIRVMYEAEMIESLGAIYRGLKGEVSTEHFERISAVMSECYRSPPPSYQMSDEEIEHQKAKNTAIFRAMRDIIIGYNSDDGYSDGFKNDIKFIFTKFINVNVIKPKLYSDRTLLSAFEFILTARERIGSFITIQAANRHVKALVEISKTRNNREVEKKGSALWKIVYK